MPRGPHRPQTSQPNTGTKTISKDHRIFIEGVLLLLNTDEINQPSINTMNINNATRDRVDMSYSSRDMRHIKYDLTVRVITPKNKRSQK